MSGDGHRIWKEQLAPYLLGALGPTERAELEHHVGGCAECQAELRWLAPAVESLPESVEQREPPSRMKERVMERVLAEAGKAPAGEPSSRGARRGERAPLLWRLARPAAAALAVLAIALAVAAGYALRGEDGSDTSTRVLRAAGESGLTARLVVDGEDGTLHLASLEDLPPGRVYEAWVQRGEEVVATDSLFLPRRDGTATTVIPRMKGVDAVMVTAEAAGGSEAPTSAPIVQLSVPG